MASDGCFLGATIDNSDGAAEGMYVTGFAPSPKSAVDQDWVQAYQAVDYRNPDTYSINGYSAMQVLAEGVKKAGTLNAAKSRDAIRGLDIRHAAGQGAVPGRRRPAQPARSTSSRSRAGSSCRSRPNHLGRVIGAWVVRPLSAVTVFRSLSMFCREGLAF